jgi:hypothetical protein
MKSIVPARNKNVNGMENVFNFKNIMEIRNQGTKTDKFKLQREIRTGNPF